MNLASATHFILSKLSAWWHDREDERLDELMNSHDNNASGSTVETDNTAHRPASRASRSHRET